MSREIHYRAVMVLDFSTASHLLDANPSDDDIEKMVMWLSKAVNTLFKPSQFNPYNGSARLMPIEDLGEGLDV